MKVSVGQVYIAPGVGFPFSHLMQRFLSAELSEAANAASSNKFVETYGADWALVLRVSAKRELKATDITGPTVFRKTSDVEYTLFLPFDLIVASPDVRHAASEHLVAGARSVFELVGIEPNSLDGRAAALIERLCSDPSMSTGAWPQSA